MATCKECERDTRDILSLSGRRAKLNKYGVCQACVELNGEIAMDDADRLRDARALVAKADAAKLLGRLGGLAKSDRKAETSRQNGKKGGRRKREYESPRD